MESSVRKPFQGLGNIVRFNWHFYVISMLIIAGMLIVRSYIITFPIFLNLLLFIIITQIVVSLSISTYIYDFSDLYKFKWLNVLEIKGREKILNINAGFDESSQLLKSKFVKSDLIVADFYDPLKHSEVSIKRAREAYPSSNNTIKVDTKALPFPDNSIDIVFVIFSAHEIRNTEERTAFFKELKRVLKPSGEIIITEHLRDLSNFIAYNIGFLHFYSKSSWLNIFHSSGLKVSKQIKTTPFITTFILEKNGAAS
jgi:Methylase involved in ubiquinone/menaquinone biosynthesis